MDYPHTYGLIRRLVDEFKIQSLIDFKKEHRKLIIDSFMKEADEYVTDSLMFDNLLPKALIQSLQKISSLSKYDLEVTETQINDVFWRNAQDYIYEILEKIQDENFTGISDFEDARQLDHSIRCREAANDNLHRVS